MKQRELTYYVARTLAMPLNLDQEATVGENNFKEFSEVQITGKLPHCPVKPKDVGRPQNFPAHQT